MLYDNKCAQSFFFLNNFLRCHQLIKVCKKFFFCNIPSNLVHDNLVLHCYVEYSNIDENKAFLILYAKYQCNKIIS